MRHLRNQNDLSHFEEITHGILIEKSPFDGILLKFALSDRDRPVFSLRNLSKHLKLPKTSVSLPSVKGNSILNIFIKI